MVLTNSRNNIVECLFLDGGFDLGGTQRTIEAEEVSDETGNMWGGHRSSGKGLGRPIVEGGNNVESRSPDVDARTEVRKRSLGVLNGGGGNGDSLFDASGRGVNSVLVLVSGSNDNSDAGVEELEEEQGIETDEWLDISREAYSDDGAVDGV